MYLIVLAILSIFVLIHLSKPNKPPIFGVYQQGTRWTPLKFILIYSVLQFRKLFNPRPPIHRHDHLYASEEDCAKDCPQPHTDHPLAIDAVYFNATSPHGATLICGVARRPNRMCNTFIFFRVENGELLLAPDMPQTTIQQRLDQEGKFHVGGLKIDVVVPMREWRVQYNGIMKYAKNPKKVANVTFDLLFKANFKGFYFDRDQSIVCTARFLAMENWSRDFFKRLESTHQSHFEQLGLIIGKAKIDDETFDVQMDALRDHTTGQYRDWRELHRYAIHFIHLDNGDQISVGKICYPSLLSNITMGFICKNSSKKVHPVDFCDFELYQHGENHKTPSDYAFQFHAGGKVYTVQVDVYEKENFYVGEEMGGKVFELISNFTVNGIKGWGVAEWQYRNYDKDILQKLEQ